ncbi:cell differentiation protein rcd1, putative [Eimeria necatrix]|nr:cell differentiation protein rcd1, putative [Eimeria necatrix]CDJ65804.1 cell differentiation protein rcd1, putative [Eimeria necatrix]
MVTGVVDCPSNRLLKHVVRCYLRLSDNSRAREALRQCLPDALKNPELHASLKDDPATKKWLMQLLHAVSSPPQQQQQQQQIQQQQQLQQ